MDLSSRPGIVLGIASTTDEPQWAMQCLRMMRGHDADAALYDYFHHEHAVEVYKASSKQAHFKAIAKKTGFDFRDMM